SAEIAGMIAESADPDHDADSFYSTAYVWLMLEQIPKAGIGNPAAIDARKPLTPGEVIPFFEHANLASVKSLEFLVHCLARKALHHVIYCEIERSYRDLGYYRLATALFPGRTAEILLEEYGALRDDQRSVVDRRLVFPRSPAEAERFVGPRTHVEVVRFADDLNHRIRESLREKRKRQGGGRSK
ncbi:MAG: hypothetical protein JXP34_15885, partial [Planctomycetes bacterium]|nr:hypothetical protein [Planctomycetota bacterium]